MRMIVFKYDGDNLSQKNTRSVPKQMNFERILFITFIAAFCILILSQTILINNDSGVFVSDTDKNLGSPLQAQNVLYDEGSIQLSLINDIDGSILKLMVNGDEVADFTNRTIDISVKNNDIIEVYNPVKDTAFRVRINSTSANIIGELEGKVLKFGEGINKLIRVRIK